MGTFGFGKEEVVARLHILAGFWRILSKFCSGTLFLVILAPVLDRNLKAILLFVKVIPEKMSQNSASLLKILGKYQSFPTLTKTKTILADFAGMHQIPIFFQLTTP